MYDFRAKEERMASQRYYHGLLEPVLGLALVIFRAQHRKVGRGADCELTEMSSLISLNA